MLRNIICFSIIFFEAQGEKYFYEDHARGWHWYEQLEQENSKQEKGKRIPQVLPIQYPATSELRKYQADLEEAKALAVLHPTAVNVFNYQKMQYDMLQKSGKFGKVWVQNVYQNPNINYNIQFPVSQKARHVYIAEKRRKTEEKIKKLSNEYGLFFFFKNNCPYCEAFSPIVKIFSEKYNWEVLAISEFGEKNELFARNVEDNGLGDTWGVNTYPSLFAVNPKTGHVIPIAVGMISIEEMEERIMTIMENDGNG